jgi:hypothetical protein
LAGVCAQSLVYPLETAKTRLAISTGGEYTGLGKLDYFIIQLFLFRILFDVTEFTFSLIN